MPCLATQNCSLCIAWYVFEYVNDSSTKQRLMHGDVWVMSHASGSSEQLLRWWPLIWVGGCTVAAHASSIRWVTPPHWVNSTADAQVRLLQRMPRSSSKVNLQSSIHRNTVLRVKIQNGDLMKRHWRLSHQN